MKHTLLFDDDITVNVEDCSQSTSRNGTVYTVIPSTPDDFLLLIKVLDMNSYKYTIMTDFVVIFVI